VFAGFLSVVPALAHDRLDPVIVLSAEDQGAAMASHGGKQAAAQANAVEGSLALEGAASSRPRGRPRPSLDQDRAAIFDAAAAWERTDAGKFVLAHFRQIWGHPLGAVIFTTVPRLTGTWRGQEVIFGSNTAPFPIATSSGAIEIDFIIFLNPIDYRADGILNLASNGALFHHTIASLVFTELSVLSGLSHSSARRIFPTIASNRILQNSLSLFSLAALAVPGLAAPGASEAKFSIPQTTIPSFDAVGTRGESPIPSGLDFANLTLRQAYEADSSLSFPMNGSRPAERADHSGHADPSGPWAGLPIAHDQNEYSVAIEIIHQRGLHLAPGFLLRLVAAADVGEISVDAH
jgi:hypothetical protein